MSLKSKFKEVSWTIRRAYYWVKGFPKMIKAAHQRLKYGISSNDAWDLHYFLEYVIVRGARQLRDKHTGVPGCLVADGTPVDEASKKWKQILDDIAVGFLAARRLNWPHDNSDIKLLEQQRDHGFALFKEYFSNLWD